MFELLTLKSKLIAGAIALVIISALLFALWSVAWGKGYTSGALSNAKPLAECRTTLEEVKGLQDELSKKAEQQRLVSERISKDTSDAWASVLSWTRSNARIVRVRDSSCSSASGVREARPDSVEPEDASGKSGLGSSGNHVDVLTLAEVNERLNRAERDAARLTLILQRDEEMYQKGLLK